MGDVGDHLAAIQQYISDMKAQVALKETIISNTTKDIAKKDEIYKDYYRKFLSAARYWEFESTKSKEEATKWKEEVAESKGKIEKLEEAEQRMKENVLKAQEEKELVEVENLALKQQVKDQLEKISTFENQIHLLMEERTETAGQQGRKSNDPFSQSAHGCRKRPTPNDGHAEDPSKVMDGYFFCKCGSVFLSSDKLSGHVNVRTNGSCHEFCDEGCSANDLNSFCEHLQKEHHIMLDGKMQTGCFVCGQVLTTREEYVAHYQRESVIIRLNPSWIVVLTRQSIAWYFTTEIVELGRTGG
ncbi:hypothetical protein Ocin01_10111 [Orchesella cincta]|uniref:Uncharacterized protein n=1 Tax=Orchesella cincta TaxID=48709 RepID=A0A1D2MTY9_ORCCI|nr:hypothetical protein Ocin01_10111 [Orchesella cincta]